MKVHNRNGNRKGHYRDIGLAEWLKAKGIRTKPTCSALYCGAQSTDGAHVTKVGSQDQSWYICPFCHQHNEATNDVELKADWQSRLVPLKSL